MYLPALEPSNNRKSLAGITEEQSSRRKSTINQTFNKEKEVRDKEESRSKFMQPMLNLGKENSQLSIKEHEEPVGDQAVPQTSPGAVDTRAQSSNKIDSSSNSPPKPPKDLQRNNRARVTFLFAEKSRGAESPGKQSQILSPNGKSHKSFKSSLSGIMELEAPKQSNRDGKSKQNISQRGSNKSIFFSNPMISENFDLKPSLRNIPSNFVRKRKDKGLDYTRIEFPKFGLVLEDDPYKKEFQNKLDRLKQLTTNALVGF